MIRTLVLLATAAGTLGAVYWFMIRPWLLTLPGPKEVIARIDDGSQTWWMVIKTALSGWKTMLWSRFLAITGWISTILAGVVPEVQAFLGMVDLDQFKLPRWFAYVGIGLIVIGYVSEKLRKVTTGPVALPPPEPVRVEPEVPLPEGPADPSGG